jgi:hypothetical protein
VSVSTRVYKNIPELLLVLGVFFVAVAVYFSREFAMSYWYVGIGIAFGFYGIGIDFVRLRHGDSDQSPKALLHNRIAELLFLLGLLFVTVALYASREFSTPFWHVGIGLAFCANGVGIDFVRLQQRKNAADVSAGVCT